MILHKLSYPYTKQPIMFNNYQNAFTNTSTYYTLMIALFVILILAHIIFVFTTRFTKTITVRKTYTGLEDDSTTQYTDMHVTYNVVDTEGEVYDVVNSLWLWSWDKAGTWATLKTGKTYTVHGYGYYVGMLDWHPCIVHVEKA